MPRTVVPRLVVLFAGALLLSPALAHAEPMQTPQPESAATHLKGTYQLIPPEYSQVDGSIDSGVSPYAGTGVVLYLNKDGGTYTPGVNDSRTNRTSIPNQTVSIPAWNVSDQGWQQVMSCVQDQFARWNVQVTDVDPGDAPHLESVVAGLPGDLGLDPNVGGVSPFTNDCSVIPNSIVFAFAEGYGTQYQRICEVVAQEVSHSFGLDHEYLCADPMTYLDGCGAKTFQDVDAQCGEGQPRTCLCGQSSQNSVQMLNARIGTAGDDLPPQLSIAQPADGDVVNPGFGVYVNATDDLGVQQVDLLIDGVQIASDDTEPYILVAPEDLAPGDHMVETIASDGVNDASTQINVTIEGDSGTGEPGGGGGGGNNDGSGTPGTPGAPSGDVVGGCSAASGSGAGAALLLLALLAVPRRRRRHL